MELVTDMPVLPDYKLLDYKHIIKGIIPHTWNGRDKSFKYFWLDDLFTIMRCKVEDVIDDPAFLNGVLSILESFGYRAADRRT